MVNMQLSNLLQINDWEIKKFLRIILSVQFAMWGAIGLDGIGLQIPILRQFIGFIYLTFIPGIIILRIMKLHKLGNIETLLYAVGLSISIIMFVGASMTFVYPFFGIVKPMSATSSIITITCLVLVLCTLSYVRDKNFSSPDTYSVEEILSPITLFLCLVLFLAPFGTYLVNFNQNNILLMFMIVIISVIVILIGFDKFISPKLYAFTIFVISFSLLFHNALISRYLWGWDIHTEYYYANLVLTNSFLDIAIPSNVNAMLSIVVFAPIFSNVSGISLIWVFKLVYPLLFSLVPLGLYSVCKKQTSDKIAFLSVFFFMSVFVFYTEMLQLARQQIAELFLVLLILLITNTNINKIKRSILCIIFAFSLVVSHYGLSYIFMFSLIAMWLLLYLYAQYKNENMISTVSANFVILFNILLISWYIFVSSSSTFISIVQIGNHILTSIVTDFLNPAAAQGLSIIITESVSPLYTIGKNIHIIAQFFIAIGLFTILLKYGKMKFQKEYVAFSLVNFMILVGGIVLPFVASSLNTSRLYQIALIFLAPFFVIGWMTSFKVLANSSRIFWIGHTQNSVKVLSVFLAIFLLFNSGFVYEIAKDNPNSISLNSSVDYPRFNEQEVLGAKWIYDVKNDYPLYGDHYRKPLFKSIGLKGSKNIPFDIDRIVNNSYIYFGTLNTIYDKVLVSNQTDVNIKTEYINSKDTINNKSMIYANGGAQVYFG